MLCPGVPADQPVPVAVTIDARGLRCPWPVLRLARAVREGATAVDLLGDDPAVAAEVAAFAAERGLAVAAIAGGFQITA